MENFAEIVADRFIGRTVDLTRVDASQRKKIMRILMRMRYEITEQIHRVDISGVTSETHKQGRLRKLLESVDKTINATYGEITRDNEGFLKEIAELEEKYFITNMNTLIQVDLMSATLTPATLRELASESLINGQTQAEWWRTQSAGTRRKFLQEMRQGVALGENNNDLARRVRGEHTGKFTTIELKSGRKKRLGVFRGGIMEQTNRQAQALVRTSVQTVANNVRERTMKDNRDILEGEQFLATLDGRTTIICISYSGDAWDFDGKPIQGTTNPYPGSPPLHFNCRSTLIPILKSWDDLIEERGGKRLTKAQRNKLRDLEKSEQASMDGQVSGDLNYEQWLKGKTDEFQKDVLGKGKWELWKEGKIKSLSELIDQSGNPLTLAQLRERVN